MLISVSVILKPRTERQCDVCQEAIGKAATVRLFGYGVEGDPPYAMFLHVKCAMLLPDDRIARALGGTSPVEIRGNLSGAG